MSDVKNASFTGTWGKAIDGSDGTNCYVNAPGQFNNAGCGITDDSPKSLGAPFNAQRGGVVATVWDNSSVRAFRWTRGLMPVDVSERTTPFIESWGTPYARFDFTHCDANHFHDHQIIFDLTFCGDWAGGVFGSQCADVSHGLSCEAFVSKGANMREAYWTVNYIDAWEVQSGALAPKAQLELGEHFYGTGPRDASNATVSLPQ